MESISLMLHIASGGNQKRRMENSRHLRRRVGIRRRLWKIEKRGVRMMSRLRLRHCYLRLRADAAMDSRYVIAKCNAASSR